MLKLQVGVQGGSAVVNGQFGLNVTEYLLLLPEYLVAHQRGEGELVVGGVWRNVLRLLDYFELHRLVAVSQIFVELFLEHLHFECLNFSQVCYMYKYLSNNKNNIVLSSFLISNSTWKGQKLTIQVIINVKTILEIYNFLSIIFLTI